MKIKKEMREYNREWRNKNPEKSRAIKQRYEEKRKAKRKEQANIKEDNKFF